MMKHCRGISLLGFSAVAVVLVASLSACQDNEFDPEAQGSNQFTHSAYETSVSLPGIMGGLNVAPAETDLLGFLVSIENKKNDLNDCTGTLVHPMVVLTAAHCVVTGASDEADFLKNTQLFLAGSEKGKGEERRIKQVLIHPRYSLDTGDTKARRLRVYFDMALLLMDRPASPEMRPVEVSGYLPSDFKKFWVVGYGADGGIPPDAKHLIPAIPFGVGLLRKAELEKMENPDGTGLPSYSPTSAAESWIVASQHKKGICYGDSGGPALIRKDGKWLQIGIASFVRSTQTQSCRSRGYFLNLNFSTDSDHSNRAEWIKTSIAKIVQ